MRTSSTRRPRIERECRRTSGADPVPGWDEAWLSYRRHMLHGLLWFLCPTQMQPLEIINANVERFGAAASDHQVDRLF